MSNIFMYAHGGSGNHGCEAIVRASFKILKNSWSGKITLLSRKPDEDLHYGLDKICEVRSSNGKYPKTSLPFFKAYMALKLKHDYVPLDKLTYKKAFDKVGKQDLALSIGGDNYCYADVHAYIMMQDLMLARGAHTVLWGCSVEPDLLDNPVIAADIRRYSLITARETISYEALKKVNPHTVLVADPAFVLEKVETELPENFVPGNMVGVNISPMIMENEKVPGIAMKNYERLLSYILTNTDMGVALIPHVVWRGGDDREPLRQLYEKFKNTGRVVLFGDQCCEKIKYVISQCRFFVGARTHATIAAYSQCVPTLVVGYSVKARGIARDLFGTEENYVLPVQKLSEQDTLEKGFAWMEEREEPIRKRLVQVIPSFQKKAMEAADYIERLYKEGN